jgi:hypothetical protein
VKLAPRGESTVFLGANGLIRSVCAGCAPLVGGFLIDHLTKLDLPFLPAWAGSRILGLHPWSFFFLATTLLGMLALLRLARVEESGEARLGVVLAAARRTAAGALRPAAPPAARSPELRLGDATHQAGKRALHAFGLPANDGDDVATALAQADRRAALRRAS